MAVLKTIGRKENKFHKTKTAGRCMDVLYLCQTLCQAMGKGKKALTFTIQKFLIAIILESRIFLQIPIHTYGKLLVAQKKIIKQKMQGGESFVAPPGNGKEKNN